MGELTAGFVSRILNRGSSLKFTTLFSSNSRSISVIWIVTSECEIIQ